MRKRYINETRGLETLMEQEIELKTKKKQKKEDTIKEYKILIVISEADFKIKVINKLNEMKKIKAKINELEKEKCLECIMTESVYGHE